MGGILQFFELGAVVFAWTIFWTFLVRGYSAAHPDSPAVQGLAAITHA